MRPDISLSEAIISEHAAMYDRLTELNSKLNDQMATARDRHDDDEVEVERTVDGVTTRHKVPQYALWDEVRNMSTLAPAWADIARLYPDIARLKSEADQANKDVEAFEVKHFGFTRGAMTLPNVMRIVRAIVKLELQNNASETERIAGEADESRARSVDA